MGKPKIRFKGYNDEWEQRKFGEIVEKYEDPIETPTEGYTRLGIRSHAKGTFHSYVEKGKELETAKMFRVAADKFIVNITFGWEHAVAITDENDAGKLVSHRFPQYSFNTGMNPKFFRYLILDENFKHHLELSSPGGAGRNRVLKLSDMLQYKMNFPSEAEQKKIAAYFDDLDNLITLHQRNPCNLNKFMAFDWEQRKLGEVAQEFKSGNFLKADEIDIAGDYPVYGGNGLRGYTSTYNHDGEFALIGRQGALCGNMNYSVGKAYFTEHAVVVEADENNDTRFLYCMLDIMNLGQYSDQSAQPGLAVNKLIKLENFFPQKEEQQQIGWYFNTLDRLITLHHHKPLSIVNLPGFTYNHHKSCIMCVKIKINLYIGTNYDIDMEYFGYLEIVITYNHHKLVYLRYIEVVIITIKEKKSMAELESVIEQKLIEQLVYGESQWTYRDDLKT